VEVGSPVDGLAGFVEAAGVLAAPRARLSSTCLRAWSWGAAAGVAGDAGCVFVGVGGGVPGQVDVGEGDSA
jgi:hypothetical protein